MSQSVWKYPITELVLQEHEMPKGARILTVQRQGEQPCVWAEVDTEAEKATRLLKVVGTGRPEAGDGGQYIGTWQDDLGFVWHLFDLGERDDSG